MEGTLTGAAVFYQEIGQDNKILGSTYSYDGHELLVLLRLLEAEQLITDERNLAFVLSVPGMLAVEKMAATGTEFAQGFVAMWFNPDLQPVWLNGFEPAVRSAGYRPFRIDQKDYIGGITDQIITEIRRSRFVVADYTEQVNGVYFEAEVALGLGLDVIPTCREDHIPKLRFDIRHLNTLSWRQPEDLASNLSKQIVAVVGAGPLVEVEGA